MLKKRFYSGLLMVSLFFIVLVFHPAYLNAQNQGNYQHAPNTISGLVINSETNEPVEFAEVFISGTTVGCITNNLGEFTLNVPFFPCTMVADHVSYLEYVENIDGKKKTFEIRLVPENINIGEVKVSGKNNRNQNLRFFYSRFINEYKNKIEILNDSVLYFKRDKHVFTAWSKVPLIIRNEFLGYQIKVTLKYFQVYKMENPGGPKIPLKSVKGKEFAKIGGYYFYEPLEVNAVNTRLEYEQNRRSSYFGSDRHFFNALYFGNFEQQGFTLNVFPGSFGLQGFKRVLNYNKYPSGKSFSFDCDSIRITYQFGKNRFPRSYSLQNKSNSFGTEISTIFRSNQIFTLYENGTSPDIDCVIIGPMTKNGNFANTLPSDYNPFK